MRKATICLLAFLVTAVLYPAAAQAPQNAVLVFRLPIPATDAEPKLARTATLALKDAFIQAGAVDVSIFDPEAPSMKRALMEKSLPASVTEAKVAMADALKAGKVLGARYVLVGDPDDATKKLHVLAGDTSTQEVSSVGTVDLNGQELAKLKESFRDMGKLAWAKFSAQVDAVAPDTKRPAQSATDAVAAAQKFVDEGDTEAATEELTRAVRLAPKDPEIRLATGRFYLSQGRLANAIVELRTAVNLDPTKVIYRLWLSDAYAQKQLYSDAESEIKRGMMLDSNEPRLYAELGKIYMLKGALDDAVTQLNRSIDLNPKDADVRILLGDILLRKGRTNQSIASYQEAAKLRPASAALYQRIAGAYAGNGMLNESLTASMTALKNSQLTDAQRYGEAVRILDEHIRGLLAKYNSDLRSYQNGALGNGDYGGSLRILSNRIGSLSKFLQQFTPPEAAKTSYAQRSLGLSLLTQAASSQMSALETSNTDYTENARILLLQAQRELSQAQSGAASPAKGTDSGG